MSTVDLLCAGGGLLVGTNVWLPEDPRERFVTESELIGCNRLFCTSCRSWVRHLDSVRFAAKRPEATDLERLYPDANAESAPEFKPSLMLRVYLCRCECDEIAGAKGAGELDRVDSWGCAGHPPHVHDPVTVPPLPTTTEAQVAAMLREAVSGPLVGDVQPWNFVLRWRPPFIFRVVWPALARLLVDSDPMIRVRAIDLIGAWRDGDAITLDRLIDVATKHTSLYRDPSLLARFVSTLTGKALSIRPYRAEIAKAIVTLLSGTAPPAGSAGLVAEYEPEAVIRSAEGWNNQTEDDEGAAADAAGSMALYRRDHVLALLRALTNRRDRAVILNRVAEYLDQPDDKLRLILRRDGVPFPQTHPTIDDCWRALGLASS